MKYALHFMGQAFNGVKISPQYDSSYLQGGINLFYNC
jgi:hypothetical protein